MRAESSDGDTTLRKRPLLSGCAIYGGAIVRRFEGMGIERREGSWGGGGVAGCRRHWWAADAEAVVEACGPSGESVAAFAERYRLDPRCMSPWTVRSEEAIRGLAFRPIRLVRGP